MAEANAAQVMALRKKTGLPMMECKRALLETEGDESAAIDWLRKQGIKVQASKSGGRETKEGRIAIYTDFEGGVGAMVELQCESAPVAGNEEFVQLAKNKLGEGVYATPLVLDGKLYFRTFRQLVCVE